MTQTSQHSAVRQDYHNGHNNLHSCSAANSYNLYHYRLLHLMHLFSDLLANVSAEIIQMDSSHTPLEDISDVFACVCVGNLYIFCNLPLTVTQKHYSLYVT